MKQYINVSIFLVVIGMIAVFFWSNTTNSTSVSSNINQQQSSSHFLSKIKKNSNSDLTEKLPLTIHKNVKEVHKNTSLLHGKTLNPFQEEDIDFVAQKLKKIKGVEPVAAVQMQKGIIKNAKIGDTLLLPPIDGISYEMKVQSKQILQSGTVNIEGDFIENGIVYSAVLTEGKKATFISMVIPNGTYEVNILNGIGYIYTNTDIEKVKIDYSQTDEIESPINKTSEDQF